MNTVLSHHDDNDYLRIFVHNDLYIDTVIKKYSEFGYKTKCFCLFLQIYVYYCLISLPDKMQLR